MALSSAYQTFLATVNPSLLASDANLNYLTTLTTFNESAAVVKHLTAQQKVLKKRNEKVISAIESANAVCLDIETTMEFMSGGGAYLPGLDDNFLADHVVTFPVVRFPSIESGVRTDSRSPTLSTSTRPARSSRSASSGIRARCSR